MKKLIATALAALLTLALASCHRGPENQIHDLEDLSNATVGVLKDSLSEMYMDAYGHADVRTYDDPKLLSADVRDGTLDCALVSSDVSSSVARRGLTTLPDPFAEEDFAIPVSVENSLLIENLNDAMRYIRASGELDDIVRRWENGEGSAGEDGGEDEDAENGGTPAPDTGLDTISVAVRADLYPYAFFDEDGELAGMEIDLVRALCRRLDLEPVFSDVKPDILLYMAESGKTAFAIGRIVSDPDNEAVTFTEPYYHSTQLIVVRK